MTAEDWKRKSVYGTHRQQLSKITTFRGNSETHLEVLGNLTNKALEGELANKQLRGLLVAPNLAESDGTRAEAVRLLHTTGSGLKDTSIYWRTMTSEEAYCCCCSLAR